VALAVLTGTAIVDDFEGYTDGTDLINNAVGSWSSNDIQGTNNTMQDWFGCAEAAADLGIPATQFQQGVSYDANQRAVGRYGVDLGTGDDVPRMVLILRLADPGGLSTQYYWAWWQTSGSSALLFVQAVDALSGITDLASGETMSIVPQPGTTTGNDDGISGDWFAFEAIDDRLGVFVNDTQVWSASDSLIAGAGSTWGIGVSGLNAGIGEIWFGAGVTSAAGGGTVQAGADMQLRARARALVAREMQIRARTRARAAGEAQLRASMRTAIAAEQTLTARVRVLGGAELQIATHIAQGLTAVGADLQLAAALRALAGGAAQLAAPVREHVGADAELASTMRAAAAADLVALARTRALAGEDQDLRAESRALAGADGQLRALGRSLAGDDLRVAAETRALVGASTDLRARSMQAIGAELDIRSIVGMTIVPVGRDLLIAAPTLALAAADVDLAARVREHVGADSALAARVRALAARDSTLRAPTRAPAGADLTLAARLRLRAGSDLALAELVRALARADATLDADVRRLAGRDLQLLIQLAGGAGPAVVRLRASAALATRLEVASVEAVRLRTGELLPVVLVLDAQNGPRAAR